MSGPLKLDSEQLRRLADALDDMTMIRRNHNVDLRPFGDFQIAVDGVVIRVGEKAADGLDHYVIDDRGR